MLSVVQGAARRALATLADRHPLPLLGGALVAGGLVVWMRPWRGVLRPALIAGIAARLIAGVPAPNAIDVIAATLGAGRPPRERVKT